MVFCLTVVPVIAFIFLFCFLDLCPSTTGMSKTVVAKVHFTWALLINCTCNIVMGCQYTWSKSSKTLQLSTIMFNNSLYFFNNPGMLYASCHMWCKHYRNYPMFLGCGQNLMGHPMGHPMGYPQKNKNIKIKIRNKKLLL